MQSERGPSLSSAASLYPINISLLPGRGRSYVATRPIEKDELVLVAESYGTTMCDPWLDCGVCHFCWSTVPNRKTQIRLPQQPPPLRHQAKGEKPNKRQPTAMVFCDDKCLEDYGAPVADMVCRVEGHIRRLWTVNAAACYSSSIGAINDTIYQGQDGSCWQKRAERAFHLASSHEQLVQLSDKGMGEFLDLVWSSIDAWVAEQLDKHDIPALGTKNAKKEKGRLSKDALFPNIAQHLLSYAQQDLESRTTDDDCEKLRLMAEALCRRQRDGDSQRITTTQATFADYCAMQSNEVTVIREALKTEMQEQGDIAIRYDSTERSLPILVALLPTCFQEALYVYLRMRDALYLIRDSNGQNEDSLCLNSSRPMDLEIDHVAFRSMLYKEKANSFGIRDKSDELLGFAVFPRACFFNHSCDPNIRKKHAVQALPCVGGADGEDTTVRRRTMAFHATRRIQQGEECCISYGDISASRVERQARLEEEYFFPCSCARCEREA
ncbi:hypothetical protein BGZ73_008171 [Actinomortierella ambigua]|nr:hypothetical protein BGZ73_008171 [Actinomortierella ambigua]